jgi:hypothetical protein
MNFTSDSFGGVGASVVPTGIVRVRVLACSLFSVGPFPAALDGDGAGVRMFVIIPCSASILLNTSSSRFAVGHRQLVLAPFYAGNDERDG